MYSCNQQPRKILDCVPCLWSDSDPGCGAAPASRHDTCCKDCVRGPPDQHTGWVLGKQELCLNRTWCMQQGRGALKTCTMTINDIPPGPAFHPFDEALLRETPQGSLPELSRFAINRCSSGGLYIALLRSLPRYPLHRQRRDDKIVASNLMCSDHILLSRETLEVCSWSLHGCCVIFPCVSMSCA